MTLTDKNIEQAAARAAKLIAERYADAMPIYDIPSKEWLAAVIVEEIRRGHSAYA